MTAYFLLCCTSTPILSHKTRGPQCNYLRLGGEDRVKDALPPVIMLQQEDILDNGGQAGFREGTIQTSLQERRPLPLQCPLAAHIPLNTETERSVMCNFTDVPCNHDKQSSEPDSTHSLSPKPPTLSVFNFTLQTRATRDTVTLL